MKNREFDKLDALLRQKSYNGLTLEEKQFVEEHIGGEKAYDELFSMIDFAKNSKKVPISSDVKRSLTNKFKSKQQSSISWLNFKLPVYANMPIVALLVIIVWVFLPAKEVEVEKIVTVQLPPKVDTLIVQSPPDTVYFEKKITIEVPVYITKKEEPLTTAPKITGQTLAEQQGLTDLLVSGR